MIFVHLQIKLLQSSLRDKKNLQTPGDTEHLFGIATRKHDWESRLFFLTEAQKEKKLHF